MNAMSNLIRVMDNIPLEAESAFYTVLLLSSQVKSVVKRLCINYYILLFWIFYC